MFLKQSNMREVLYKASIIVSRWKQGQLFQVPEQCTAKTGIQGMAQRLRVGLSVHGGRDVYVLRALSSAGVCCIFVSCALYLSSFSN